MTTLPNEEYRLLSLAVALIGWLAAGCVDDNSQTDTGARHRRRPGARSGGRDAHHQWAQAHHPRPPSTADLVERLGSEPRAQIVYERHVEGDESGTYFLRSTSGWVPLEMGE